MNVETLPLSIGPEGICLRGPLFNYSWSWDEIAMDLGCEPRESTTLHYLADGKIGLHINTQAIRIYARQDFADLVRKHGTKGASA